METGKGKKRGRKKKEVTEQQTAAPASEQAVEIKEVPAPEEPKKQSVKMSHDPEDQIMSIDEAASLMMKNFRENWLPAIRAKAKAMGAGETATKRVWRAIFMAWGGPGIMR